MIAKPKDINSFLIDYAYYKVSLALLFLFFSLNLAIGQTVSPLSHSRSIFINGHAYTEDFSFIIKDKDTIPHGSYQLSKIANVDSTQNIFSVLLKGMMKQGLPNENWMIRSGYYQPDAVVGLNAFNLSYSIKGREINAKGAYDSGKKTGSWQIYELIIENSKVKDTTFSSILNFQDNKLENRIDIRQGKHTLQGKINDQNYLDGQWKHRQTNSQYEIWEFELGLLNSINLHKSTGITNYDLTKHLSSSKFLLEPHDLNAKYLDLLNFIIEKNYPEIATDEITFLKDNVLLEYPKKLLYINESLVMIKDIEIPTNFMVTVPAIILGNKDSMAINALKDQMFKTRTFLDELKNNVQIKALSEKVTKLNEYKIIIDRLTETFLKPMEGLVEDFDKDVLKYYFTPTYLKLVYQKRDTINYGLLNIAKKYALKNTWPNDIDVNIDTLVKVIKALELEFIAIKSEMMSTIQSLERMEAIVVLESALIQDYEAIIERINGVDTDELNTIAGFYAYEEIKIFLERAMSEYLSIEDEDKKMTEVPILLECIEDMGFLLNRLDKLPQDVETIDRLYINIVFNPYTFTNMEDRINPGIYNAFQYTLLPSLIGKLKSMECKNISFHRDEYDVLLQGMVDLLKTNNKKVERYVKRTRDPQKIVNLLGIKIEY